MENLKTKQIADLVAGMKSFKKVGERCVGSATLIEYANGNVQGDMAKHIRAHLLFCDDCAKEVAALWSLQKDEPWSDDVHVA